VTDAGFKQVEAGPPQEAGGVQDTGPPQEAGGVQDTGSTQDVGVGGLLGAVMYWDGAGLLGRGEEYISINNPINTNKKGVSNNAQAAATPTLFAI